MCFVLYINSPTNNMKNLCFQEKLLAKLYIEILGLAKNGDDAKKLTEFRNPKTNLTHTGLYYKFLLVLKYFYF